MINKVITEGKTRQKEISREHPFRRAEVSGSVKSLSPLSLLSTSCLFPDVSAL